MNAYSRGDVEDERFGFSVLTDFPHDTRDRLFDPCLYLESPVMTQKKTDGSLKDADG